MKDSEHYQEFSWPPAAFGNLIENGSHLRIKLCRLFEHTLNRMKSLVKNIAYRAGFEQFARNLHTRLFFNKDVFSEFENKTKSIFIQIPKTGTSSILVALSGKEGEHGHFSAIQYRKADPVKFREYFKFAFVRNPLDRFVSSYFYYKEVSKVKGHKEWAKRHLDQFNGFQEFCEAMESKTFCAQVLSTTHFRPQIEFVSDGKGKLIIDKIYQFDDIENAFEEIKSILKCPGKLEKLNSRKNPTDYSNFYTARTRQLIENIYATDFDLLQY